MENPRHRILGVDDQIVLWVSLCLFLACGSFYYFSKHVNGGLVDFDDAGRRHAQFVVDINSASWQEFANLPGIGEKLAREIVDHRESIGSFPDTESLTQVRGVGEMKLKAIRPFLSLTRTGVSNRVEFE